MKYIGFPTSSWREVLRWTFPLVTECSVFVIRIRDCSSRIVLHVDNQLSPSLLSQTLIYASLLSAWERGPSSSAWQYSSRHHEAIDPDRKCHSWYQFLPTPCWSFTLLSEVTWLVPSLLFHISWLGDVKQSSVSDSSGLALKAKIHASSWRVWRTKRLQKHINSVVIALETGEHVQHNYQKTADSNQITSAVQLQHSHY